tara:strand:+ start:1843 stop:3129 length:1287 start_codon:yes stop_codon:yes gene_type:complete
MTEDKKEKLNQELNFLKESFEAEVITQEEYDKGMERIKNKLKDLDIPSFDNEPQDKVSEPEQTPEEKPVEAKTEEVSTEKVVEEPSDTIEKTSGPDIISESLDKPEEPIEETTEEPTPEPKIEIQEQSNGDSLEDEPKPIIDIYERKSKALWKRGIVWIFIILVFVGMLYFIQGMRGTINEQEVPEFHAGQSDDNTIFITLEPDESNEPSINIGQPGSDPLIISNSPDENSLSYTALTSADCINCNTQRINNILKTWFGSVDEKKVNYETSEGESLASELNVEILPAYVFSRDIENNGNFNKYRQAFIDTGDYYVLSSGASASTFYANRDNIDNSIDLFIVDNDLNSQNAENNANVVVDMGDGEVNFNVHLMGSSLANELKITTAPLFLFNNKAVLSGVQSPDTLKTHFCKLNSQAEICSKSLSKSLI